MSSASKESRVEYKYYKLEDCFTLEVIIPSDCYIGSPYTVRFLF